MQLLRDRWRPRNCVWTILFIVLFASHPFNQSFGEDQPVVQPGTSWEETASKTAALAEHCQYPEAIALASNYLDANPAHGPAIECRIWLRLDFLDLKDLLSFPGLRLRREKVADPARYCIIPPDIGIKFAGRNNARESFFDEQRQSTYVAPSELNDIQEDLARLQKLRGIRPEDTAIRAFIAEFIGDRSLAEQLIQRNHADPATTLTPREQLIMCRILQINKRFGEAIESADKAMADPTVRSQALSRKAQLLMKSGSKDDAKRLLDECGQMNPDDPRPVYLRQFLRKPEEFDQSLRDMESLDVFKDSWAFHHYCVVYRVARSFSQPADIEETLAHLAAAIESDPQLYDPYLARSSVRYMNREWGMALQDITKVIELNPYFDVAYGMRATIYRQQQDYQRAQADYSQVVWLKQMYALHSKSVDRPTDARAAYALALHLIKRDELAWSAKVLSKCIQLDPAHVNAIRDRSTVLLRMGELDQAMQDAECAVRLSPIGASFRTRAEVYAEREEWDRAVDDFERSQSIDGKLEHALRQRASWHKARGRFDAAREDLLRADKLRADLQ